MAKKNNGAFLPHEDMMERFRKEGRVSRTEISLKALKVDHRLQAREKPLDLDNVKALHAVVKDGLTLAPIVVFRVDGKDYVANGFHRVAVHKKEGLAGILADVVTGTWQEAVEYSTCCNMANHALTPTKEDKKKACEMLLGNGWVGRSAKDIAKHVGASPISVVNWRVEWSERNGRPIPEMLVSANGKKRRSSNRKTGDRTTISKRGKCSGFQGRIGGELHYLPGRTIEDAESAAKEIVDRRTASLGVLASTRGVSTYLARRGLWLDCDSSPTGLKGGACLGFAVTFISDDLRSTNGGSGPLCLVAAVGRVMLLSEHYGRARKVVLVFQAIVSHETIVDLARRLGIEFMTLEQFVEVAKADEGEAGATVAV